MRLSIIAVLVVGLASSLWVRSASGQVNPRERRRQIVEGLLRSLIESQGGAREARPPAALPGASPQVIEARRGLQGFSQESDNLINLLRHEETYAPGIRPLLADSIRLKATCDQLVRQANQARDVTVITRGFNNLDREWRVLAHRLRQMPNLDNKCLACIKTLSDYDQQLCRVLNVQPQLDRPELIRTVAALDAELGHLLEEIAYDLRQSQRRNAMLLAGRRLQLECKQLSTTIARGGQRDVIVPSYQNFYTAWRAFAGGLRGIDNPHLERSANRIDLVNREIHELLWLPVTVDRARAVYLAKALTKNADALLSHVSVKTLIELPNPTAALTRCVNFYEACNQFAQTCGGQAALDDLLWDYRELAVEWQNVSSVLSPIKYAPVTQHLSMLEQDCGALRDCLGIRPVHDRRKALRLAAAVDSLSHRLQRDVNQCLTQTNYPGKFRADVRGSVSNFHKAAHHFHESVVNGAHEDHLRKDCTDLRTAWQQLRPHVPNFAPQDQQLVRKTYAQIGPSLVKLQVLYAL